ncbi:MAG: HNH endonuclease [Endomicrobium sp.]|jgi:polyferredoxin|nr:HNH endonuclease [Endomicrobium sp.]
MKQKLKPIPKIKKELDALWSAKVRERDGRCALCGKTGKGLQAHHFIKTRARSLKYRWDIRNGITLCYACHFFKVHDMASFEIINQLMQYATTKGILTPQEVAEIINDGDKRDVGNDRGFLEACRIELEAKHEQHNNA